MPKQTLLCIDDDPDDQFIVLETIKDINPSVTVDAAINGIDALDYLSKAKICSNLPSIIFLDMNMPVMNGKETLAAIKRDNELSKLPVIVFTTSSNKNDKLFCESYGVDFYTKPNNPYDLTSIFTHILTAYL